MEDKEATGFETLMGGKEVTVIKQDGSTEVVKVLQLPIQDYPKLLSCLENESAQLELYCAKPAGWAKTLTPPAHDALMQEAERINGDFFGRWARRRMAKLEALKPGLADKLFGNLQPAANPASSPAMLPKSP